MVNKPRRRKQGSHGRTYLVLGIILVLVAAGVSYVFMTGLGPFGKQPTSTTTATTDSILYARINTTKGSFDVELFNSLAPKTVANFVNLVNQGFYNGLIWHRIEPGFVIQTGDPNTRNPSYPRTEWGTGSSGIPIPVFENASSLHNYAFYLGMASDAAYAPGTSQFYINLSNSTSNLSLDGKYAVFGKVISGMGVVKELGSVEVEYIGTYPKGQNEPTTPVYVISIIMINGP
jgi:dolichyl-diphosphooligosaccharide--protein glycosyltransferase